LNIVSAYHRIIREECKKYIHRKYNTLKYEDDPTEVCLSRADVLRIVGDSETFEKLVNKGFFVHLKDDYYRSLHMDVAIRSASLRTYHEGPDYIVSPRIKCCNEIEEIYIPSKEDRVYLPNPNATDNLSRGLYEAIFNFFKEERELVEIYVNFIRGYFSNGGFDPFQAYTLSKILELYKSPEYPTKKAYVISAPTGAGKTEIFAFYMLAKLLKNKVEGEKYRALLVYPRKTLAIDQTYRFIKMLHILNSLLLKVGFNDLTITLGVRDGDTPKYEKLKEFLDAGEELLLFRGINCPLCGPIGVPLIYDWSKSKIIVRCTRNHEFPYVIPTKEDMGKTPPDVLISNMWAVEYRITERVSQNKDLNLKFFKDLSLVVVDEAHEYVGLSGGVVSGLLRVISKTTDANDFEYILSSATLPNPKSFGKKLTGMEAVKCFDYHDITRELKRKGVSIKGVRLVILGIYDINPQYSWSTYVQLWSIYMAFLNYVYELQGKEFRPISIVFIQSIPEIRRAISGINENLSLGEPRDHVFTVRDPLDPYSFVPYIKDQSIFKKIERKINTRELKKIIMDKIEEMHSQVPYKKRHEVITKLKSGEGLGVVLSTSSLELGVDYDNVSFILNVGFDNVISLRQRIGRGGRSLHGLRTVLGIILTKKVPTEAYFLYDEKIFEKLHPASQYYSRGLKVSYNLPKVRQRCLMLKCLIQMAEKDVNTYSSGKAIKDEKSLKEFLEKMLEEISGEDYDSL